MEGMTVGEVARTAGVTVRTLHHWDRTGLVVPSGRTPSGYRVYAPEDLERVVRVLGYRDLGFPLEDVARLLDEPGVDVVASLDRQHALLVDRIAHLQAVAELVRRTKEARRMGIQLDPQEVREVFGDADPTQHAQEAQERWGDTDAYRQSQQRTSAFGKDDWLRVKAQGDAVEARFAALLAAGVPATSPDTAAAVAEHRAWVGQFYDCTPEMQCGLAEMYLTDERFRAHYDDRAPGLAQYVHDAVKAAAGR